MHKILMFVLAAFLATGLNCCMAETYNASFYDKFNIEVTSDQTVKFADQYPPTSYPDFTAYLVDMWIGNDLFETIIADYGSFTNVSRDALLHTVKVVYPMESENKPWVYTDVGGQKGLIANVTIPASIPQFEITYSPDAIGNRGTMIVAITAYTNDEKMVKDVLKTLQIHRIT